jgi:hypothetical protein
MDFSFDDLGGNYCYSGGVEQTCLITSPGIEPPAPIP